MRRIVSLFSVAGMLFLYYGHQLSAQNPVYPNHPLDKKVIIYQTYPYDWSHDLATNLPAMQANRPYVNGLIFTNFRTLDESPKAFNNEVWTEADMQFADLATIATKWTTFTDNFLFVTASAQDNGPDFFNDAIWSKIIANATLMGKAVKTAACKGIEWDPEFYWGGDSYSPWWFTVPSGNHAHVGKPPYTGKTFAEVKAKAHQRGKEYVQALQVHMPKITIMTTMTYDAAWEYSSGNPSKLTSSHYALLPAFVDGMIEALNPESIIVDGNEGSYYNDETNAFDANDEYMATYKRLRIEAPAAYADPSILAKWNSQVQIAQAPYLDLCYNEYDPHSWNNTTYQSKWMTHNLYNSLLTSDQYVWVYIESSINFWTGIGSIAGNVNVFSDMQTAVTKFRNGEALGYDMYNPNGQWSNKASQFVTSPVVTITSSSNNTPGNITVSASINPETSISKVEFFANAIKIGESTAVPYSITKSFVNTDYTIYARVYKTDGTHNTSAPIYLIAGLDNQAPAAPSNLTASSVLPTSAKVNWTASTDDVGILCYEVFKDGVSIGTTANTSLPVSNLTCETNYVITVKARDFNTNFSETSSEFVLTTASCNGDISAPAIPAGLVASSLTSTSVTITWSASLDNVKMQDYIVYVNGELYRSIVDTTITIYGLIPNTGCTITIAARDAVGHVSNHSLPLSITTLESIAPTIPTDLYADAITEDGFTLSWTASTDNIAVTGYEVFIRYSSVGKTIEPTFQITKVSCGQTYSVYVKSFDASGNYSAQSSYLQVKTADCASESNVVKQEIWTNIAGKLITNIPLTKAPDQVATLSALEVQNYWADMYGTRIRGYIIPPETGSYVFYIASDDNGELWLSTDDQPSKKSKIAFVKAWTGEREWTKEINQKSVGKSLIKDQKYYFEALMKEGDFGDNLAIAWTIPNSSAIEVISRPNIDKYTDDFEAPSAPTRLDTALVSSNSFVLKWLPATDNVGIANYSVYKNNVFYASTSDTSLLISGLKTETLYTMAVKAKDAAGYISDFSNNLYVKTTIITGINDAASQDIIVYPNPANSKLTIANIPFNSSIQIFNALGEIILSQKPGNTLLSIDVKKWNKGLYFVIVTNKQKTLVEKIIVE